MYLVLNSLAFKYVSYGGGASQECLACTGFPNLFANMPITLLRQQKAGQAASNSTITSAQQDGNNTNLGRNASLGRSITRLQTQLKATVTTQHQTNWALLNVILSTFIFLVVSAFELMIIVNLLNFVNITFGKGTLSIGEAFGEGSKSDSQRRRIEAWGGQQVVWSGCDGL